MYNEQCQKVQLSALFLPEELRHEYFMSNLRAPVSAYCILLDTAETRGFASQVWPQEIAFKYMSKMLPRSQCIEAEKHIPIAGLHALQDIIKNKVLGFVIDIEKLAPDAGESPPNVFPVSEEKVAQIFNINIAGNVANLANGGTDFTQTANISVSQGNISELHRALTQVGVPQSDVASVQAEIEVLELKIAGDVTKKSKLFHIRELATKLVRGLKNVTTEVASDVMVKIISGYIGIN